MIAPTRLILHADDLGMNRAVNEGILRGFRQGLLTSTSLLANAPDVEFALREWKTLEEERSAAELPSAATRRRLDDPTCPFDLGVHLNLTQGRPLTTGYPAELLDAQGRFPGVFSLFARLLRSRGRFRAALRVELERQLQVVRDHGLQPSHVNGHQYIEMIPAVTEIMTDAGWDKRSAISPETATVASINRSAAPPIAANISLLDQFRVRVVRVAREPSLLRTTVLRGQFPLWPLARVKRAFANRFRTHMDALEVAHPDAFFGAVHAGKIDLDLMGLFLGNKQQRRSVEIGLHPAEPAPPTSPADWIDGWHDPLASTRPDELQMLVSAKLAALIERSGWQLGRLTELPAPKASKYAV